MGEFWRLGIEAAAAGLSARAFTAVELLDESLTRIAEVGPRLNLFLDLDETGARQAARASGERHARSAPLGPLDGVALAVKGNVALAGLAHSAGIPGRHDRIAEADASVVARLRAAGAVVLGTLNLHEAALGATTDNPYYGRTGNPHDAARTPGGSSGGSGAAVAAFACCGALGTDTMGSVRLPAAYCGTVGLKPSRGLVSTRGVLPLSWRLDHVGPLTRSVGDAALLLEAMAGPDPADPLSRRPPPDRRWPPEFGRSLAGLRLARLANFDGVDCEPAVRAAFARACEVFRGLGTEIVEVELPGYEPTAARRAGLLVAEADGAAEFEDLLDRPGYFSEATHALLSYGRRAPAPRLARAERLLAELAGKAARVFETVDAVISPTAPQAAFRFGEPVPVNQADLTALANFADWPALSLPMGRDANRMPLGLQVMTATWAEALALELGAGFEAATA